MERFKKVFSIAWHKPASVGFSKTVLSFSRATLLGSHSSSVKPWSSWSLVSWCCSGASWCKRDPGVPERRERDLTIYYGMQSSLRISSRTRDECWCIPRLHIFQYSCCVKIFANLEFKKEIQYKQNTFHQWSTSTLKMTTAQAVETSVTVNNNSPIQDYVHPDDQIQPTFEKF